MFIKNITAFSVCQIHTMLEVLSNRTYRHLLFAQVIALLGTGLATVALSLLAFDLAGAKAGAVLGTALAIKMLAYIGVAQVASALAERLPRRTLLVATGPGSRRDCAVIALCDTDLAGLCADFYFAICVCCLHADFPGDDS